MSTHTTPRRAQLVRMSEAELTIRLAIEEVEKLGADVRLTDAVVLLGAAKESVADYIDGVDMRRFVEIGSDERFEMRAALAALSRAFGNPAVEGESLPMALVDYVILTSAALRSRALISEGSICMAVDRIGGTVEGKPTHEGNYLQRIEQLIAAEADCARMAAENAALAKVEFAARQVLASPQYAQRLALDKAIREYDALETIAVAEGISEARLARIRTGVLAALPTPTPQPERVNDEP